MNIKFSGKVKISTERLPKGYSSEAAKAAFHDIRQDKDMRIHTEILGIECLCSIILTEEILEN